MNALTPLHIDIFRYIASYTTATGGISPLQREIAQRFRYKGVATIHAKMHDLKRAGMIDWMPKRHRSITVLVKCECATPTVKMADGASVPVRLVPIDRFPA